MALPSLLTNSTQDGLTSPAASNRRPAEVQAVHVARPHLTKTTPQRGRRKTRSLSWHLTTSQRLQPLVMEHSTMQCMTSAFASYAAHATCTGHAECGGCVAGPLTSCWVPDGTPAVRTMTCMTRVLGHSLSSQNECQARVSHTEPDVHVVRHTAAWTGLSFSFLYYSLRRVPATKGRSPSRLARHLGA